MIEKQLFGKTRDGKEIYSYVIINSSNAYIEILEFGGIIQSIVVPDRNGTMDDVTTGYDILKDYENNSCYFGAIIGRCANRISGASFEINGKTYPLYANVGNNHLHGGFEGFHKKIWSASIINDLKLELHYRSLHLEEGYPGNLVVSVTYEWTEDNKLIIDYIAECDQSTVINLTNHAYFNLAGHKSENIYNHLIQVHADRYLPKNDQCVPSGKLESVNNTVFDLRKETNLGERLKLVSENQVIGFDHAFCFNETEFDLKHPLVTLTDPDSGRVLTVLTNQPSMQLYTANYFSTIIGKGGAIYKQHSAVALETQNYPDAVHQPHFPSCIIHPNERYYHQTIYKFSVVF